MTLNFFFSIVVSTFIQTFVPTVFFYKALGAKRKWLAFFMMPVSMTLTVCLLDVYSTQTIKTIAVTVICFISLMVFFGGRVRERIITFIIYLFISFTCDFLCFYAAGVLQIENQLIHHYVMNFIMILICPLLLALSLKMWKGIKAVYDKKFFAAFCLIPVVQLAMLALCIYLSKSTGIIQNADVMSINMTGPRLIGIVINMLLIVTLVADLIFLNVSLKAATSFRDKERLLTLEKENSLNYEYYQGLQSDAVEMRKFRHDINNILETVGALTDNPSHMSIQEIQRITSSLEKEVNGIGLKSYCKNNLINCMLASYEKRLTSDGIKCVFEADVPAVISVSELDLCRLITNLIDNAHEACIKIENAADRFVELSVKIIDGYLCVKTKNPFDAGKASEEKKAVKEAKNHGLGLNILKQLTEKHNGTLSIEKENGIFEALATLKLP